MNKNSKMGFMGPVLMCSILGFVSCGGDSGVGRIFQEQQETEGRYQVELRPVNNQYGQEISGIKDLDKASKSLARAFYLLGLSLIACVFTISGVLFVKDVSVSSIYHIPVISWIFWGLASYIFIRIALLKKF